MWVPHRSSEATVLDKVNHRSYKVEILNEHTIETTETLFCCQINQLMELSTPTETAMVWKKLKLHHAGVPELPDHPYGMTRVGHNRLRREM